MPTLYGFRHAPVSKGLIFATAGASILTQAARASRRGHLVPSLLSQGFIFRSPAELLFGTIAMYYFRILEREMGSNKFGAFATMTTGLAAALQWAASRPGLRLPPCPSGPYGFIFSCFVQYFFLVPPSSKMVVLGWRFSDKVFMYLLGLQLLFSSGSGSLVAGGAGLLAGLAYRLNLLGIKRLRLPGFLTRFLSATLGPLLNSEPATPAAATAQASPGRSGARQGAAGTGHGTATAGAGALPPQRRSPGGGTGGGGGGGGTPATAPHLPLPSREAVEQLVAMGFPEAEATRALQLTNNDIQGAIGLLLSA